MLKRAETVSKTDMNKLTLQLLLALLMLGQLSFANTSKSFLEEFPHLEKQLFEEPSSKFMIGTGITPFAVLSNRIYSGLNLFQIHWQNQLLDIEVLNASLGFSLSSGQASGSRVFSLRAAPKVKIFGMMSVGPLIGMEFVSFPEIQARLFKGGFGTPLEPFSSRGLIYGLTFTQTFALSNKYLLRINESVYQQTYSTSEGLNGWIYVFDDAGIQADRSSIKGSLVIALEVSLLF